MDTAVATPENETPAAGAPPSGEPMDPSRMQVIRQIGQGGMATIHLALLHGAEGTEPRQIALKLMHSHLDDDASLVRRFEHEVRSQAGLRHPNVVEMAGWGREGGGRLFMAMEYVDGPALRDLLASGRRFPADVAAHVTRGMLAGLQAAHARGLVHRDVKPANVMTTLRGEVKVADFGISKAADMTKLTSTGNVIGTPAYMSPEQALARDLDCRSDLFSVGVVLYEMLVGGNPFQTGNPATTLSRVVHHQHRPAFETLPQVPGLLDELAERLLQKDPAKRLASAGEALALLDRCISEEDLCATEEAFAAFITEPETATRKLNARRARRHFERGCRFYSGARGNAEAATWEFFLATLLDPADAESRNWLEQVSRERGYNLQRKPHPRIDELEAQLKDSPDSLPVVLQLAKLHKTQGNFLQVIYYYKRARALRPPDNYTRQQIETLVSAHAASLLDGTGVFETADHVPVRVRPAVTAPSVAENADGVVDFARGVLSTGGGRLALAAAAVVGCVVIAGFLFDKAAVAAGSRSRPEAPVAEPEIDRQVMLLERGREQAEAGRHAEAEKIWRAFLDEFPESGLRSEALFRLGESLERQGRRPEALEVHGTNAADNLDEWALRSRSNRAEMFSVEGDLASARREYEGIARVADGEQKLRAQLSLANISVREGRRDAARAEFESVLVEARDTPLYDDARLDFADFLSMEGDTTRARMLWEDVREHADHHGEAFRRASGGLLGLDAMGSSPSDSTSSPADAPPQDAVASASSSGSTEPATMDPWGYPATPQPASQPAMSEAPSPDASTANEPTATEPSTDDPAATGLLTGLGGR